MVDPLFAEDLVPPTSVLSSGYTFRSLQRDDFANGHLEVLKDLAFIGEVSQDQWTERFDYMRSCPNTYYVLVIVKDGRLVGTGTLVAERKFLFELGIQGHIEDIAIAKSEQGKGLGLALLNGLYHIAVKAGCYKTILDCSPKNVGFYERCGYVQAGREMQRYIDPKAEEHHV